MGITLCESELEGMSAVVQQAQSRWPLKSGLRAAVARTLWALWKTRVMLACSARGRRALRTYGDRGRCACGFHPSRPPKQR